MEIQNTFKKNPKLHSSTTSIFVYIGSGGRSNGEYKVRSEWKENQFYNKCHGTQKYWSSEGNLNCLSVFKRFYHTKQQVKVGNKTL